MFSIPLLAMTFGQSSILLFWYPIFIFIFLIFSLFFSVIDFNFDFSDFFVLNFRLNQSTK